MFVPGKMLLIPVAIIMLSGTAHADISYTLNLIPNSSPVYTGETINISFLLTNYNFFYSGMCAIGLDSEPWSSEYVISAGSTLNPSLPVKAPPWGSGAGNVRHIVNSYCYDLSDQVKVYRNVSFNLNYTENPGYIASIVNSAIYGAQSAINNAQSALDGAKDLGADAKLAESKQLGAKNLIGKAGIKKSDSDSYFSSGRYEKGVAAANESRSFAEMAKINADNAYYLAIQAELEYNNTEEGQTKSMLSMAQSTYFNAISILNSTNDAAKQLSGIGVETGVFIQDMEKISLTLNDSKPELEKARTSYENREFNDSRALSGSIQAMAEKNLALLNEIDKGMASSAIDKVNNKYTSVSKSYDIAAGELEDSRLKLDEDIFNAKKEKLDNAKKSLDIALNLISQARYYSDNRRYSDVVTPLKAASEELGKAEHELKSNSQAPSFKAIPALAGISVMYLAAKKTHKKFKSGKVRF
ncbi:MAG: hypothetical protein O8C66_02045 [Candidatus Methanoperedens sp.]|nr:hypothetical protein [Candidatus Methanoperedens sp.]MCZ7369267.1 hypothetical protein [Candidatus Methanoperedens sp.]